MTIPPRPAPPAPTLPPPGGRDAALASIDRWPRRARRRRPPPPPPDPDPTARHPFVHALNGGGVRASSIPYAPRPLTE
ncbi:hypothetical protein ZWY2020_002793 [Hordeum vulgare]|nr:hypothetical protein ZWY2020_002793 [Hordeum vulgare]